MAYLPKIDFRSPKRIVKNYENIKMGRLIKKFTPRSRFNQGSNLLQLIMKIKH